MIIEVVNTSYRVDNPNMTLKRNVIRLSEEELPNDVAAVTRSVTSYKDQGIVAETRLRTDTGLEITVRVVPEPLV